MVYLTKTLRDLSLGTAANTAGQDLDGEGVKVLSDPMVEDAAPDRGAATLLEKAVALGLLIATLPLFAVLSILILLDDGRPVFYSGERLGKGMRPFRLLKFRTLARDAEARLGGRLLGDKDDLVTRSGRILRETRLDELPQIINVLRGDMQLIGPRPERRAVYESLCKDIKGYEKRFLVKPGVIGYSQLFTPHGAPKRQRVLIDNLYINRSKKLIPTALFLTFSFYWLARRAVLKVVNAGADAVTRKRRTGSLANARRSERVRLRNAWVELRPTHAADRSHHQRATLVDVSDAGVAVRTDTPLEADTYDISLVLEARFPPRRGIKRRVVRCTGTLLRSSFQEKSPGYHQIYLFHALGEFDQLLLQQYFLRRSIF
jgi:lipopolysaccharide/colanic/teichoic acid biosynthesis glycosyltransferase